MIKMSSMTARVAAATFWAVFFSGAGFAADSSLTQLERGLDELVYRLSRSVVTIESSRPVSGGDKLSPTEEGVFRLISSGIVYDFVGHILVSAPAVAGQDQIVVHFGNQSIPARLRGVDYQTGLAVIHVDRKVGAPAEFGSAHGCAGQMVVAIGNAYGMRASPSLGFCAGARPDGVIQFSAPITSETVGGGLFNLSGQLLGIITGGIGSGVWSEAGLAVPAHEIPDIVRYIIQNGDRLAGYIGITTSDIEISPGIKLNLPNMLVTAMTRSNYVIERGILIASVVPFSPAARAGLRRGDLLFSMDKTPLRSSADLRSKVRQTLPGTVPLTTTYSMIGSVHRRNS
jgi:serine protease Do